MVETTSGLYYEPDRLTGIEIRRSCTPHPLMYEAQILPTAGAYLVENARTRV
jgi:hypothetical protein